MGHDLFGGDSREQLLTIPNEWFHNEREFEDSGDHGLEVDGFEGPVGDDTGTVTSNPEQPATPPAPAPPPPPATPQRTDSGEAEEKKGPPPMFDSLDEWIHGWLLPLYRRSLDVSNAVFCPEWWRHPEAYLRLDALWKSWEFMRRKPGTGMAVWLRDYCDYHMAVLMREQTGPFKGCSHEHHNPEYSLKPWSVKPMPPARHIARLYDQLGVQHARPELAAVQTQQWDGVDQK
jgi:hypothetical protein